MDSLPNELLDHVLIHVARPNNNRDMQDATSLTNCCLVSRRFHRAAQPLLYSAIHLELMTDGPNLLLNTFKSNVQLAKAVRKLFIQCGAPCSTPTGCIKSLRNFLEGALPLFTNLTTFKSDHRITTIKLVETALYHGSGYTMNVPINLGNIRTLELFAADYIYKYNYILRLPCLERVVLHSMKIIDLDGDDRGFADDWGWTSQSIKKLEIHQGFRSLNSTPYSLRSNSLQALAKSVPCLEYLRLYHYECTLYPRQSRHLLAFFTSQLRSSLRRLTIEDGRIDLRYSELGYNYLVDDGSSVLDDIKASNLQSLRIDLHTLCNSVNHSGLTEAIHSASLPASLHQICLRYVELNDVSSVGDPDAFLYWDCWAIVQELIHKCPLLATVDVELRLLRKVDISVIERFEQAFESSGILLRIVVHECPAKRRSSLICSRRA